jgi:hypothetical protein
MKWTCMSMCLFIVWSLRFWMNIIVFLLSKWLIIRFPCFEPKVASRFLIHIILVEVYSKATCILIICLTKPLLFISCLTYNTISSFLIWTSLCQHTLPNQHWNSLARLKGCLSLKLYMSFLPIVLFKYFVLLLIIWVNVCLQDLISKIWC